VGVGEDDGFVRELVMKRAVKAVEFMHILPHLRDPQGELLLLRYCMCVAKMYFSLRTCKLEYGECATTYFDFGLRGSIEDIMVCGVLFLDIQWRLASLPIRFGVLVYTQL